MIVRVIVAAILVAALVGAVAELASIANERAAMPARGDAVEAEPPPGSGAPAVPLATPVFTP
jgi:hypothetical protein